MGLGTTHWHQDFFPILVLFWNQAWITKSSANWKRIHNQNPLLATKGCIYNGTYNNVAIEGFTFCQGTPSAVPSNNQAWRECFFGPSRHHSIDQSRCFVRPRFRLRMEGFLLTFRNNLLWPLYYQISSVKCWVTPRAVVVQVMWVKPLLFALP